MISATTPEFWQHFWKLPPSVQRLARKNFRLWRENHSHPSLHFKKVGEFWSARVGEDYRALGYKEGACLVWAWIGDHDEYRRLIKAGR